VAQHLPGSDTNVRHIELILEDRQDVIYVQIICWGYSYAVVWALGLSKLWCRAWEETPVCIVPWAGTSTHLQMIQGGPEQSRMYMFSALHHLSLNALQCSHTCQSAVGFSASVGHQVRRRLGWAVHPSAGCWGGHADLPC